MNEAYFTIISLLYLIYVCEQDNHDKFDFLYFQLSPHRRIFSQGLTFTILPFD